jgi:hypothetical protein
VSFLAAKNYVPGLKICPKAFYSFSLSGLEVGAIPESVEWLPMLKCDMYRRVVGMGLIANSSHG